MYTEGVLEHMTMLMILFHVPLNVGKVVGMVIAEEVCVEPSQCTTRSEPPVVQRTSEDGQNGCMQARSQGGAEEPPLK